MPVIKSAIKRVRQAAKSTERNRQVLSHMRSLIKNIVLWTKDGELEKANEMFPRTQKAIDMAAKKNLIHKNNAARRKSALAKAMTVAAEKAAAEPAPGTPVKAKAAAKKSAPKAAPKKKKK